MKNLLVIDVSLQKQANLQCEEWYKIFEKWNIFFLCDQLAHIDWGILQSPLYLCKENGCSVSTTGFMSGLSGKETC
jgi:hypothetical protein